MSCSVRRLVRKFIRQYLHFERRPRFLPSKLVAHSHSKRAKALFGKYHLSHDPYVVEVDLRRELSFVCSPSCSSLIANRISCELTSKLCVADGAEVKKLLGRKTLHHTFPNIIIGSRSIGGTAELEELETTGELKTILAEAGVTMKAR